MHRKPHEKQQQRSELWTGIFTMVSEGEVAPGSDPHPILMMSPVRRIADSIELKEAIVIEMKLDAPSGCYPCNVLNRKEWTKRERRKVMQATAPDSHSFARAVSNT